MGTYVSNESVDVKALVDNGYVIFCDTNIFLNIYRVSPDYATFALECLKSIKDVLYVPYTVKIEFYRHNKNFYYKRKRAEVDSAKNVKSLLKSQREKMSSTLAVLQKMQFPNIEPILDAIRLKYNDMESEINGYFSAGNTLEVISKSWEEDYVEKLFEELIKNNHLLADFSRDGIYEICEEGKNRYKKNTPPGYKDASQKDGIAKYSDLILWKEIIRYAKQNQKNIIFVTDDVKPDWWNNVGENYVFLPELVEEFKRETKAENSVELEIVPFTSKDFLKAISNAYGIESTDAIEQALSLTVTSYIQSIWNSIQDELKEQLENYLFRKNLLNGVAIFGNLGIDAIELLKCKLKSAELAQKGVEEAEYLVVLDVELDICDTDVDMRNIIEKVVKYQRTIEGSVELIIKRKVDFFDDLQNATDYVSMEVVNKYLMEKSKSIISQTSYRQEQRGKCAGCGEPLYTYNLGNSGSYCKNCEESLDV